MTKILFVCLGNICRSPMAEFMMRDLVKKAGLSDQFHIESAATSSEELGNPVYPPVRRLLAQRGIDCTGKTARRLERADWERFDLLIGMDEANLRAMRRILLPADGTGNASAAWGGMGQSFGSANRCSGGAGRGACGIELSRKDGAARPDAQKIYLLLDFTDHPGSVADPWYTRDFEATWRDVSDGCRGLLQALAADGQV